MDNRDLRGWVIRENDQYATMLPTNGVVIWPTRKKARKAARVWKGILGINCHVERCIITAWKHH